MIGLTNNDINSVVNDACWDKYENQINTISYESDQFWGATSNDFSTTIEVTVMGCVEEIAYLNNFIDDKQVLHLAEKYKNEYGGYLKELIIR